MQLVWFLGLWSLLSVVLAQQDLSHLSTKNLSRRKRSILSFPDNSSITITLDLMWPVTYMAKATTFFNIHLPFRYWMPTYNQLFAAYGRLDEEDDQGVNYDNYHVQELERANRERRYVYKHIESMFSSFGWDGLGCLQRAICEVSQAPVGHNDLFGNILTLLLTPPQAPVNNHLWSGGSNGNLTSEPVCSGCDLMGEPYQDEYVTAFNHGKQDSCSDRYASACPFSLFSILHV